LETARAPNDRFSALAAYAFSILSAAQDVVAILKELAA